MAFKAANLVISSKERIKSITDLSTSPTLNKVNINKSIFNALGFKDEATDAHVSIIINSDAKGLNDMFGIQRGIANSKDKAKTSVQRGDKGVAGDTYGFSYPQFWSVVLQYALLSAEERANTVLDKASLSQLVAKGLVIDSSATHKATASLKHAVDENGDLLYTQENGTMVFMSEGELATYDEDGEVVMYPETAAKYPMFEITDFVFDTHTRKAAAAKVVEAAPATDAIAEDLESDEVTPEGGELAPIDEDEE